MAATSPSSHVAPPLDLHDFRDRSRRIYDARVEARQEYEQHGLDEADCEHRYRVEKAKKLATLRAEGKAQDEALALSEGDIVVAEHKRDRDRAATLKRSALERVAELERNAASLRVEATMSEGIER